ncbi:MULTISPECIES: guanine deaminase [unclassified Janthinobacterium]|uniref:guanine deaminase n=1 Tax=unclassified Janthinobacterium TaxID=2610881 RepID=UPI00034A086C|nr:MULTISPECIES: guanine deaminase [unclassified Janthinobacterium]MEC5159030.1 guanine deaminase [Janthinobacterium sp. CG_S6]
MECIKKGSKKRLPLYLSAIVAAAMAGPLPAAAQNQSPSQEQQGQSQTVAYRGSVLHFLDDPATSAQPYEYFEDGVLLVGADGKVKAVGPAASVLAANPYVYVVDYTGKLIMPGFIDSHVHYPQTEMIGSYGQQLLEWLETYTFPTEKQFADKAYAQKIAKVFLNELARNGTTTALVFGTVHPQSVDALFEEASARNMRLIGGKVMMDRNAPDYLLDTALTSYTDSKALIQRWHNKGRLRYAVTPRFAPTSTPEQLTMAGKLLKEFPDVYMHTHLSENKGEIAWVQALFPASSGYLDVYNGFGLSGKRSIYAHGVHLRDDEFASLAATGSAVAFCPTSNLFLGSGLFDLQKAEQYKVKVGLGSDVGAGTSFSALRTMGEAYKVSQLHKAYVDNPDQRHPLTSLKAFYLATLGAAKALDLDDKVGSFRAGREADFIVVNPNATDLMRLRMQRAASVEDKLFVLQTLGDDRNVEKTYVMGKRWAVSTGGTTNYSSN